MNDKEQSTPRTDTLVEQSWSKIIFPDSPIPAEFARQLEKELNEAKSERDEARQELENRDASGVHSCHANCKRPICVIRRERDEARREAETWRWHWQHRSVMSMIISTKLPWEK